MSESKAIAWRTTHAGYFDAEGNAIYPVTCGRKQLSHRDHDELNRLLAGWISVEKQLPPMNTPFDAWHKSAGRLTDHGPYVGSWDENFRRQVMQANGITHWMPLPGPPGN